MKRTLIAVLVATSASVAFADQYRNNAGEQDASAPIAGNEYRNNAGEQDFSSPIAANDYYRNEAGQQDEHFPQIG